MLAAHRAWRAAAASLETARANGQHLLRERQRQEQQRRGKQQIDRGTEHDRQHAQHPDRGQGEQQMAQIVGRHGEPMVAVAELASRDDPGYRGEPMSRGRHPVLLRATVLAGAARYEIARVREDWRAVTAALEARVRSPHSLGVVRIVPPASVLLGVSAEGAMWAEGVAR